MKRDLLIYLDKWKQSQKRKPLLIRGARQVGKSWLAKELGKEFNNFVEINFEKSPELCSFFNGDIQPNTIITNLANYFATRIIPGETLLFLDEIQFCPRAIVALRYFYEDIPELHVISAGSLLEFELKKISVPVGRIEIIYVYPMSFGEYLTAAGKESWREMLLRNDFRAIPDPIHNQILQEIRNFVLLGGMPEVVANYLEHKDLQQCIDLQSGLIETYRRDFYKYAQKHQVQYLNHIFEAVPLQIGRKFKYSNVSNDIKSRELSNAMELLEMAGLIYRVCHSSANGIPLKAEINPKKFKVLFFDIGLAQRILKLDYRALLLNPDISLINNGAIAELFAGLELIVYQGIKEHAELYYWHREAKSSNAEIDYVMNLGNKIIPFEVKSSATGRMKSLKLFLDAKHYPLGIKISKSNYSIHESIQTIPFYGIESLIKAYHSLL